MFYRKLFYVLAGLAAIFSISGSSLGYDPDDTNYPQQWNLARCHFPEAWEYSLPSLDHDTITIAIFDLTGINGNHPDLAGRVLPGYNAWDNNSTISTGSHAQNIAGICGAITNNGIGVASTGYNIEILPIKAFPDAGVSYTWPELTQALDRAFDYCRSHDVDIVSFSVIFPPPPTTLNYKRNMDNVFNAAYDDGIIMIAGTVWKTYDTATEDWYPAMHPHVLGVGKIDMNGNTPGDFAQNNIVVAPDQNIWTVNTGTGYTTVTGLASFAVPHVTGLAALLLAHYKDNPNLTYNVDLIYSTIRNGAEDLGVAGQDYRYGYGIINAQASLALITNKFEITDITYNQSLDTAEIFWNSLAGKTYNIFYCYAPNMPWYFARSVTASGSTSSWIDDGSWTSPAPVAIPWRIYRIERPGYPSF